MRTLHFQAFFFSAICERVLGPYAEQRLSSSFVKGIVEKWLQCYDKCN